MTEPEFTKEGDPTEATLEFIKMASGDWVKYMLFIGRCWDHSYGKFTILCKPDGSEYRLATGGWSANEMVIQAMEGNTLLQALCWQSSHRGGLHIYKVTN